MKQDSYISKNILPWLLALVAFTLPFPIKLNSAAIILAVLAWIFSGELKQKITLYFKSPFCMLSLALYAIDLIGYVISDDKAEAGKFLESRLALVVLPLVITTGVSKPGEVFRYVCRAFYAGLFVAVVVCLFTAGYRYMQSGDPGVFFYHAFGSAVKMHAVYFAYYLVFALVLLSESVDEKMGKKLRAGLGALFVLALVLLSSKMMLAILAVLGALLLPKKLRWRLSGRAVLLPVAGAVLLAGAIFLVPQIKDRFMLETTTDWSVVTQKQYSYETHFTGTSLRVTIWRMCLEVMADQRAWLAGTGTGDDQHLLDEKYREHGIYMGSPVLDDPGYVGYGPHNQLMQAFYSSGIIGLGLLIALQVFLFRHAFAAKQSAFLIFVSITVLFFMTESVLNSNKGIVFYFLFASLFTKIQSD